MLQPRQFSLAFLFLEILWLAVFAGSLRWLLMLPERRVHFACLLAVVAGTALGTFFGGLLRNMAAGAKVGYIASLAAVVVLGKLLFAA
jgi:hypothetical protein